MRKLKIVFMGTPEFAVATLDKIVNSPFEVTGVITAPDKPAGRGRKLNASAVKKYALAHNLKVLQPVKLRDPEFLSQLAALDGNVFIVVAFRMLPEVVWQMPKYGTINLHASLLPDYRGAAPINWAVINGEQETGVTTFYINEKIDTGEIILQERTSIGENETAGELHDRLMEMGADLVVDTLKRVSTADVKTVAQLQPPKNKIAPKIHKESCRIDWTKKGRQICNHIRGLSPYPGAWTHLNNGEQILNMKILRAVFEAEDHTLKTGSVRVDKRHLKIAVNGGYISLVEVQIAGKRKMGIREVLNGLKIDQEAHMS
jgi:methionyl-tRNA formyltransferase